MAQDNNYIKTIEESIDAIESQIGGPLSKKDLAKKRNSSKRKKVLNFIFPLLVTTTVSLSTMPMFGLLSIFKRNDTIKYTNLLKTIETSNSETNTVVYKSKEKFKSNEEHPLIKNHIKKDSGWVMNENTNLFERTVDTYMLDIKNIDENDISTYTEEDIINSLRQVDKKITKKPVLTEEDKKHLEPITTLTYLTIDEDDFYVVKENIFILFGRYSAYFSLLITSWLLTNKIRGFKLQNEFDTIDSNYKYELSKLEDSEQKILRLEIRKNNMKRLDI